MKTENAWKKYADKKPVFDFCEGYKEFMSLCKTEECENFGLDMGKLCQRESAGLD